VRDGLGVLGDLPSDDICVLSPPLAEGAQQRGEVELAVWVGPGPGRLDALTALQRSPAGGDAALPQLVRERAHNNNLARAGGVTCGAIASYITQSMLTAVA